MIYGHVESFTFLGLLSLCPKLAGCCFPLNWTINQDKPTPPMMRLAPNTLTDIHQSISLSCQVGSLPGLNDCAKKTS